MRQSDLFTLVGNSFDRKNLKIKNQITVGKNFSGATDSVVQNKTDTNLARLSPKLGKIERD